MKYQESLYNSCMMNLELALDDFKELDFDPFTLVELSVLLAKLRELNDNSKYRDLLGEISKRLGEKADERRRQSNAVEPPGETGLPGARGPDA